MQPDNNNNADAREALLAQLRAGFASMSPQFQTASRYLLDHPQEVSLSSMRSIAANAGVQPATLVRLAQSLGYEGWHGIREIFVAAARNGSQPYANRAKEVVRAGNAATMMDELAAAQHRNLELWRQNSPKSVAHAADLLSGARNVHIAGFRASFPIAFSFHYVYRLFRPSVFLIRGEAGALEMELRLLSPKDVLFAISFAPYSQEIIQVVQAARAAGCKVVALTDSTVSPIALQADCTLQFSVESPSFFPSVAAGMAAVEALVTQLLAKQGRGAIKALEAAEGQLHQTGAYVASGRS